MNVDKDYWPHQAECGAPARHLKVVELGASIGDQVRVWGPDHAETIVVTILGLVHEPDGIIVEEDGEKKIAAPDTVGERISDRRYVWSPLAWLEPLMGEVVEVTSKGKFRIARFTGLVQKVNDVYMLKFVEMKNMRPFFALDSQLARRLEDDECTEDNRPGSSDHPRAWYSVRGDHGGQVSEG